MDNLSLEVLLHELRPVLVGSSVQRIKQAHDKTLVLLLHSKAAKRLIISLEPSFPVLFLSEKGTLSEGKTTNWLLTLRKYLPGGRIRSIRKEFSNRVVFLEIENYRLSRQPERFRLVLELIPHRANALLLSENQEVISSFVTPQSVGEIPPADYQAPSLKSPLTLDGINKEEFSNLFRKSNDEISRFLSTLGGMGPLFVQEIALKAPKDPEVLWTRLLSLLDRIRNGPFSPQLYFPAAAGGASPVSSRVNARGEKLMVTPFPLECLSQFKHQTFQSMNAACAEAYRLSKTNLDVASSQQVLLSKVLASVKKKTRLLGNLRRDLSENQSYQIYRKYAELLYATGEKSLPKGLAFRMLDLFNPEQGEIEIPLDPKLSPIQNANRYIKLYQKANRSTPQIFRRIRTVEAELAQLESQRKQLAEARDLGNLEHTVEDTKQETKETARRDFDWRKPLARGQKQSVDAPAETPSALRRATKCFLSSDGMQILVGKSSKDNDTLTFKTAKNDDFWFHVAGYAGSHVVLKNPAKLSTPPPLSFIEAAQLAAYFSQARNAPKVEVHYTQRKFVSKPKGAKPGLVRLKEHKSVSVRPQLLEKAR